MLLPRLKSCVRAAPVSAGAMGSAAAGGATGGMTDALGFLRLKNDILSSRSDGWVCLFCRDIENGLDVTDDADHDVPVGRW